jgi:CRISPR-associated protein (TIGR02584 family)
MGKKNLFLCVAGETVPTVTEGIFGLCVERRIPIHKIRILTTSRGRDKLASEFPEVFKKMKKDYPEEIGSLEIDLRRDIGVCMDQEGRELEDIRNEEENNLVADWILGEVSRLCSDPDNIIHASVAGGRKTMSVYLDRSMQLLGRIDDRLYHVLVDAKYEKRGFYYPTPYDDIIETTGEKINARNAKISMAEIPFVRIGALFEKSMLDELIKKKSFSTLIERADDILRGPSLEIHAFWRFDQKERPRLEFRLPGSDMPSVSIRKQIDSHEFVIYTYLLSQRKKDALLGYKDAPRRIPMLKDEFLPEIFLNLLQWVKKLGKGDGSFDEEDSTIIRSLKDYMEQLKNNEPVDFVRGQWYENDISSRITNFHKKIREEFEKSIPGYFADHYFIHGIGRKVPPQEKGLWYINVSPDLIFFHPDDILE